jgi:hypothetical protein
VKRFAHKAVLWFLAGVFCFLYLLLFVPPVGPFFLAGDVSVYLLNAARMLHGQVIYKDFFQFTTPGTELVYLALFRWLGARAWVPSAMMLLLGVGLTWLSVLISRKVIHGSAVLLPGALFLTCSFYRALDPTHHWYSILCVTGAVAIGIEKRNPPVWQRWGDYATSHCSSLRPGDWSPSLASLSLFGMGVPTPGIGEVKRF